MPRGCRRKACSAQRRGEGDKAGGGFVTGNPVKRKRRKKEGEKKGKEDEENKKKNKRMGRNGDREPRPRKIEGEGEARSLLPLVYLAALQACPLGKPEPFPYTLPPRLFVSLPSNAGDILNVRCTCTH